MDDAVAVEDIHLTEGKTLQQHEQHKVPVQLSVPLDGVTLWHLVNERFHTPKAEIFCKLASPVAFHNVTSAVLHELSTSLLKDLLNEELYLASMADLETEFTCTDVAMVVKISGYSDKSVLLFNRILNGLIHCEAKWTETALTREIEQLQRSYRDANLKSSKCCQTSRLRILVRSKFAVEKKLEVLNNGVTLSALRDHIKQFRNNLSVEWLVEGNVSAQNAMNLLSELRDGDTSGLVSVSSANVPHRHITQLEPFTVSMHHVVPSNPLENNRCVDVYFQLGPHNLDDLTQLDLLEQLISEPYFDSLRTKQQVSCLHSVLHNF